MYDTYLLIGAALCFALAAAGVSAGRVGLVPLGLLLWVLAGLV